MKIKSFGQLLLFVSCLVFSFSALAADKLWPFYLAKLSQGNVADIASESKKKLTAAGFNVVGEYSPYADASIIIISNDELQKNAAATKMGGFGAVQRVSITKIKEQVQVAYTNPIYMAHAYHLNGKLEAVEAKLKSTLGFSKAYGPKDGMSAGDIADYHYMFGMPYFDDTVEIMEYPSYDKAIAALEKGLSEKKGGVSKVYRVDLPGKKQSVFGVAMTKGMSNDKTIMTEIDFKETRSTAHLPYEVIVTESGKIYALDAKFRIAINFTDLSMAGSNSFMGIMASPDAIVAALTQAAGGEVNSGGF